MNPLSAGMKTLAWFIIVSMDNIFIYTDFAVTGTVLRLLLYQTIWKMCSESIYLFIIIIIVIFKCYFSGDLIALSEKNIIKKRKKNEKKKHYSNKQN